MRISQARTGKKLNYKTFGELEKGDTIYWAFSADKNIENIIYTVKKEIKNETALLAKGYTDLNPDKKGTINCDRMLKLENQTNGSSFYRAVPSNATYFVEDYSVYTTSQELLMEVLKKYKITSL